MFTQSPSVYHWRRSPLSSDCLYSHNGYTSRYSLPLSSSHIHEPFILSLYVSTSISSHCPLLPSFPPKSPIFQGDDSCFRHSTALVIIFSFYLSRVQHEHSEQCPFGDSFVKSSEVVIRYGLSAFYVNLFSSSFSEWSLLITALELLTGHKLEFV